MKEITILIILTTVAGFAFADSLNVGLVGHIDTPGHPYHVFINDNYAYIGDGLEGLRIIDISNPSLPEEIGVWDIGHLVSGVFVTGFMAWVACQFYGLHLIEVSTPSSPVDIAAWDISGTSDVTDEVFISDDYAYVIDVLSGLRIIDISSPLTPFLVGSAYITGANNVYVNGDYAYVIADESPDGLRIIDVSSPSSPFQVGFYDIEEPIDIYVYGTYAYVTTRYDGLRIIDVSTPSSPSEAGYYGTGRYWGVYVSGDYAYVAAGSNGLRVIDISSPSSPSEVGFYEWGGHANNVCVSDAEIYVTSSSDGLRIFDFDTSMHPDMVLGATSLDFGEVLMHRDSTRTLSVSNDGGIDLTVFGTSTTSTIFASSTGSMTIHPDSSHSINVTFTPDSNLFYEETLWVYSNDDTQFVELIGQGLLPPQIWLSDTSIDFGDTLVPGSFVQKTIYVGNNGEYPLPIDTIYISSTSSAFSTIYTSLPTISPDSSWAFIVGFVPPTEATYSGTLFVCSVWDTATAIISGSATGMEEKTDLPEKFDISSIVPNPFNSSTRIEFGILASGNVTIEIYDLRGQKITSLEDGNLEAGHHEVIWNGQTNTGEEVQSGLYLIRATSGNEVLTKHVIYLK